MKKSSLLLVFTLCLISTGGAQSGSVYLSPTSVHIGHCWIGQPPCVTSTSLYNTTGSQITISRTAFEGATGFTVINPGGGNCGATLAANSHCAFTLQYDQNAGYGPGTFSATFYAYDSASGSPQTAAVTAYVTCQPGTQCD
jgi:hypothetical protein